MCAIIIYKIFINIKFENDYPSGISVEAIPVFN